MNPNNLVQGRSSLKPAEVGILGERIAQEYLREHGYGLLATNWRPHGLLIRGELDIIARDGLTLVFVEVKTRTTVNAGHPLEAITAAKVRTLRRLAHAYLTEHQGGFQELRFDAIAILLDSEHTGLKLQSLEHLKAVS